MGSYFFSERDPGHEASENQNIVVFPVLQPGANLPHLVIYNKVIDVFYS